MKGNNEFHFCESQIIEMIQEYFNTKMFRDGESPTVVSVNVSNTMGSKDFKVSTSGDGQP